MQSNSNFSREQLIDRIKGAIFAQALGDAYGLATEFQDRYKVFQQYGNQPIPFPDFYENHHNRRWQCGDWTDDTDQAICIMQMFITHKKVSQKDLASRLYHWMRNGFPECNDSCGMGIGATILKVLSHPKYLQTPSKVSMEVYKATNSASNGALMRTCPTAIFDLYDKDKVEQNTVKCVKVTHHHPKVLASCVFMTSCLNDLIRYNKANEEEAIQRALNYFSSPDEQEEFKDLIAKRPARLMDIGFDFPPTIGYIYICLQAFLHAMRVTYDETNPQEEFKRIANDLCKEGGDADTNMTQLCALGARMGYSNLPQDWIAQMPYLGFLEEHVDAFLSTISI
jgi:ADP-ribosylglycohydrolase